MFCDFFCPDKNVNSDKKKQEKAQPIQPSQAKKKKN